MRRSGTILGLMGALALAVSAGPALADGTSSGTTITNTVTVRYSVGGEAQTPVDAFDTFTVDRKISLTVAEIGSTTTIVSPGQLAAVTSFSVTNTSNATLDFALSVVQQSGGGAAHSGTDTFDVSNIRIYQDAAGAGAGSFGPEDVPIAYLDELSEDGSATVFIVVDIPTGRVTGDVAGVALAATAREGGAAASQGAAIAETSGANTAGVDTVFADGAGATDGARDGAFSAYDDYTAQAAAISVSKSSQVISDPFNGASSPKLIPGAVVEYCIIVRNASGGADANNVTISDTLPPETTYLPSFGIRADGSVSGSTCNADGAVAGVEAAGTVSAVIPTVAAGAARGVLFRVTVK
ncbi:MAG: hypothetical protein WC803_08180 [Sphingomonas sp.]